MTQQESIYETIDDTISTTIEISKRELYKKKIATDFGRTQSTGSQRENAQGKEIRPFMKSQTGPVFCLVFFFFLGCV